MIGSVTEAKVGAAPAQGVDWVAVARALGPTLAARAPAHDANDSFPQEDYQDLKEHRVFSAGIPAELGGGGASHAELCAMLRELGRHSGATALALSMHLHLAATLVWVWRQGGPVAPVLSRIAAEQLVLVTTSAADWLDSNGQVERVDGGYRVSAHKHFASGSPAGDLLITTALYDDPTDGPTVLHFTAPMAAEGVRVLDNWRTLAMRASGSNDIVLDNVFVPDDAVSTRRPKGAWIPMYNVVAALAAPSIMSVYVGVAEAARDLALRQIARKRDDPTVWHQVGEMENALTIGQMATESAIELAAPTMTSMSDIATTNAIFIRKTIAAEALLAAVEKALEVAGGPGIFREVGLERLVRDLHAIQFHPLPTKRQQRFTGRLTLGLDPLG